MTTKNPRLTITLQPTIAAQLKEISRLTGNSQSSLIADLLDGSSAVFDRVIQVLTAAEGAKQALKGKIASDMEQAQTKMEGQLGLALEQFDGAIQPVLDHMEDIKRRARRATPGHARAATSGARSATSTPLSNRGVRYDPKATKTIAQVPTPAGAKPTKHSPKNRGGV
jgi:hypothetical protein